MKKRIIALTLVILLLAALPLSVSAVSDDGWITNYTRKTVTCPRCKTSFEVQIQHSYYIVHGEVVTSFHTTSTTCPNCQATVTWKNEKVNETNPYEKLPGVIVNRYDPDREEI